MFRKDGIAIRNIYLLLEALHKYLIYPKKRHPYERPIQTYYDLF